MKDFPLPDPALKYIYLGTVLQTSPSPLQALKPAGCARLVLDVHICKVACCDGIQVRDQSTTCGLDGIMWTGWDANWLRSIGLAGMRTGWDHEDWMGSCGLDGIMWTGYNPADWLGPGGLAGTLWTGWDPADWLRSGLSWKCFPHRF